MSFDSNWEPYRVNKYLMEKSKTFHNTNYHQCLDSILKINPLHRY